MTSKNDIIGELRTERLKQNVRLVELKSELLDITRRLTALEKAQNQPAPDPDELERLRTANEQLIQQNEELAAANRRIADLSTKRWKAIQDLRAENDDLREENKQVSKLAAGPWTNIQDLYAENARLRELLAVTDQHAGEIVRALAVAEDETREMGK